MLTVRVYIRPIDGGNGNFINAVSLLFLTNTLYMKRHEINHEIFLHVLSRYCCNR